MKLRTWPSGLTALFSVILAWSIACDPAGADEAVEVIEVTELEKLRAKLGTVVTVKGTATGVGASKTGKTRYLNFAPKGEALFLAFRVSAVGEIYTEVALRELVGKEVVARGKVTDFNGIQILVSSEDEILSPRLARIQ